MCGSETIIFDSKLQTSQQQTMLCKPLRFLCAIERHLKCIKTRQVHAGLPQSELSFKGQTAIITGAGRGLGREYALQLSARGARVVVNDYGGSRTGEQSAGSADVAHALCDEIKRIHPNAPEPIASDANVADEKAVKELIERVLRISEGKIDIVINNAGILRDKSFAKMTLDDWDAVHSVHLRAAFLVTRACWPHMRQAQYGRILVTSSTSGIYGNFGQANYAAAKMGLIGFSNTLAIEGARDNIHCNALVPLAASRLTADILPEDLQAQLDPARVAPLAIWLCHKDCQASGGVYEAAGGWFGSYEWLRSRGRCIKAATAEQVAANWVEITQTQEGSAQVHSFGEHLGELIGAMSQINDTK